MGKFIQLCRIIRQNSGLNSENEKGYSQAFFVNFSKNSMEKKTQFFPKTHDFTETHAKKSPKTEIFAIFDYRYMPAQIKVLQYSTKEVGKCILYEVPVGQPPH